MELQPNPTTMDIPPQAKVTEVVKFKNQLQELAHKAVIDLPEYRVINEGLSHSPCFRATVKINGKSYTTTNVFKHRKEAEQEAAKLALEDLSVKIEEFFTKDEEEWTLEHAHSTLLKLIMFWKSILHEFATKEGSDLPVPEYCTVTAGGTSPYFESHIKYKGVTYPAVSGRSKKDAEQLAACVAIQALLGDPESATTLLPIIKSKAKHFSAMHALHTVPENSIRASSANLGKLDVMSASLVQASSEVLPAPTDQCFRLPIEFVPASGEQIAPTSSKKKRKSRRGAKKRARARMDANAPSVSQAMGVLG